MAIKDEIKAQKASTISSIIALSIKENETSFDGQDPEARVYVEELLNNLLASMSKADRKALRWADVCNELHYDVFLARKQAAGGASAYDLIRPGLVMAQFSHKEAYDEHKKRVDEAKERSTRMKVCNKCSAEKPVSAFSKKGGATCNSCRMRKYRANKVVKPN